MKYRGNLKEKGGDGDMIGGGEVKVRDDNFRAPQLEKKASGAAGKGKGKSLAGKFAGKAFTGRGGGGKGKRGWKAKDAAAILGKRC